MWAELINCRSHHYTEPCLLWCYRFCFLSVGKIGLETHFSLSLKGIHSRVPEIEKMTFQMTVHHSEWFLLHLSRKPVPQHEMFSAQRDSSINIFSFLCNTATFPPTWMNSWTTLLKHLWKSKLVLYNKLELFNDKNRPFHWRLKYIQTKKILIQILIYSLIGIIHSQ